MLFRQNKTICLSGLLLLLLFVSDSHAARLLPSANKECSICHVMWLNDFKEPGITTLIPYDPKPTTESGREDAASTDLMCFSCHDGWTLDSREMWKEGKHNHPVGVKPSDKVTLPTKDGEVIFPLNEDGKVYCGTCHTAHRVDWEDETGVFMSVRNPGSEICLYCHKNKTTGPEEGNHPVLKKFDKRPDKLLDRGAKFSEEEGIICESCHNAHGTEAAQLLVLENRRSALCVSCHEEQSEVVGSKHDLAIMAPGEKNSVGDLMAESGSCSACHQVHHAKGSRLWALAPVKDADAASGRCLHCHQKGGVASDRQVGNHSHPVNVSLNDVGIQVTQSGWQYRSSRVGGGRKPIPLPLYRSNGNRADRDGKVSCMTCHDPHRWSVSGKTKGDPRKLKGTGANSFLRMANRRDSVLCLNCHPKQAPVIRSKHNVAQALAGNKLARKTKAGALGPCSACHATHNGKGPLMWTLSGAAGKGDRQMLCLGCHKQGGVGEQHLVGEHSHPTGVPLVSGMRTRLPLNNTRGKRQMDCFTCHDPHNWSPDGKLPAKSTLAKLEGDADNSFLRMPASAEAPLCVECHSAQRSVVATDHDLRITAPETRNHRAQTPQQSGVCGQCHSVHNALDGGWLSARKWSGSGGGEEKACIGCHRKGGVADAKVPPHSDHPEEVTLIPDSIRRAAGRPNTTVLPMFDRQGKPSSKGRITCATCHQTHRWDAKKAGKGAGRNLEGTVENSFLRLESTAAFACADCHGLDSLFRYKFFHDEASRVEHPLYR